MPIFYNAAEVAELKHRIAVLKDRVDDENNEKWRVTKELHDSERKIQELQDELERERKKYRALCSAIVDVFATTDAGEFLQEFSDRSGLYPRTIAVE